MGPLIGPIIAPWYDFCHIENLKFLPCPKILSPYLEKLKLFFTWWTLFDQNQGVHQFISHHQYSFKIFISMWDPLYECTNRRQKLIKMHMVQVINKCTTNVTSKLFSSKDKIEWVSKKSFQSETPCMNARIDAENWSKCIRHMVKISNKCTTNVTSKLFSSKGQDWMDR